MYGELNNISIQSQFVYVNNDVDTVMRVTDNSKGSTYICSCFFPFYIFLAVNKYGKIYFMCTYACVTGIGISLFQIKTL